MMLGMDLSTLTMVHVIISLIGIVSGLIVLYGLLGSNPMPGLTALFLLTTILTSAKQSTISRRFRKKCCAQRQT